jgi:Na+/melibiose symporter-like transporter
MGMTATILLMTPIAGWMLDAWGYIVIFPAIGVVGILAAIAFGQLRVDDAPAARDPDHPPVPARAIVTEVLRNKPFLWFLLLNTLFGCGTLIGAPLYAIVQVNRLGLSYTEVGYLGLVQSLTWFLGYFFWGRITDRFGPVAVLVVSMLCGALMPLCFLFAESFWWLLPAFIGQGLLFGGFELGLTNTAMALANRLRLEMYFAVMHVVSGVRGIIVPLLTPVLIVAQVSEQIIFGVGTGLILVSVLIATKITLPATDSQQPSEVQQEVS